MVASASAELYLAGTAAGIDLDVRADRFYAGADRAFWGEGLDFSGVGLTGGGHWVTMISPVHFLTARHHAPELNERVAFHPGNDAGLRVERRIGGWLTDLTWQGGTSDLMLGRLDAPLAAADGIRTYPVLELPGQNAYTGEDLWIYGRDHRLGRNEIDEVYTREAFGTTRCMAFTFESESFFAESEAYLMPGDSGAASFAVRCGELMLAGIHFFNQTGPGEPFEGARAGDSFVPAYIDQISDLLAAEGFTLRTHPEAAQPGDVNLDGVVNLTDLTFLGAHYGSSAARWVDGDFNGDGQVELADLMALGEHFHAFGPPAAPAAAPEPSGLVLLGFGTLLLGRRRRRN
jgi:hypothetical protein